MIKERFLANAYGVDQQAIICAMNKVKELCETHNCNALLLVPALKEIGNTGLRDVIPESQIKMLANGHRLHFTKEKTIAMCSPLTLKSHNSRSIILALFASESMIKKAEDAPNCESLVVVPWNNNDAKAWIEKKKPIQL